MFFEASCLPWTPEGVAENTAVLFLHRDARLHGAFTKFPHQSFFELTDDKLGHRFNNAINDSIRQCCERNDGG